MLHLFGKPKTGVIAMEVVESEWEKSQRLRSYQGNGTGQCGIKRSWGPQPARCDYPTDPATIYGLLEKMAGKYGVSYKLLRAIVSCEGWTYSANTGTTASGVFQYLASTWQRTPFRDRDIFDPFANVEAAVSSIAANGTGPWEADYRSYQCWSGRFHDPNF